MTNDPVVVRATFYSPVRFTPAVGVTSGAHYRTSIQELLHLRSPHKLKIRGGRLGERLEVRGTDAIAYQGNWRMHRLSWRISASKSSKETDGP